MPGMGVGIMKREIEWAERGFVYKGEYRELDERTILLDAGLTEEEISSRPHIYRDILEAFSGPEVRAGISDKALSASGTGTGLPAESSAAPGTGTGSPVESSAASGTGTGLPAESSAVPGTGTGSPAESSPAPRGCAGVSEMPVTVYMAPGVYWIDDPEATDTMQKREGYSLPFGMYIDCAHLKITGLCENPADVVIAGNRGQSHACNGNYTMIHFRVNELSVSNLTLGNYCSVDLVYPMDPARNYPKRTETVTQAQLAIQQGEKLYAENCRFVSRLNLTPICGAERALYKDCHFESTDDALNGNAVYVGCDFDFYGGRPIFQARETGDVFIDCVFRSMLKKADAECCQYLTKEGGPVALISCRYESHEDVKLGWTKYPGASLKCFQYQVSQNGHPVILGGERAAETVQLQGKKALEAYLVETDGERFANVGNLLGGRDEWDPMGMLEQAKIAGKTGIPTLLTVSADASVVVSGEPGATVTAQAYLFSHETCRDRVAFYIREEDKAFLAIRQDAEGSCIVEGCNHSPEAREVVVHACTEGGLEAAVVVMVEPYPVQAPVFLQAPILRKNGKTLTLEYQLSSQGREDISEICWYRCDSPETEVGVRAKAVAQAGEDGESDGICGSSMILCAVSKRGIPLKTYRLTAADGNKYMKAVIWPKVKGSLAGEAVSVFLEEPVGMDEVDGNHLFTDFSEMPEGNQRAVQRGRWTLDCAKPEDIHVDSATFGSWAMDGTVPAWKYGETGNGSLGAGLYQNTQGARLRYTPVNKRIGNMSVTVKADPAKTAGQGFGSAGQYMDFGIKFDTENLTGYALRVIRVREASDAVAMALVEYRDGRSAYLTDLKLASCFLTGCTIRVALEGKKLSAEVSTETPQPGFKLEKGYAREVELEAEVEGNPYGGVLVWHTGTPGTGGWQNTTMLHSIEVNIGN